MYKLIWYLIIIAAILALLYFGWYTYKLDQPLPGQDCHSAGSGSGPQVLWNTDCLSIQEKAPDNTLLSPTHVPIYLLDFKKSSSAGPAWNVPTWYRIRYVNAYTGGYSDFSQWHGPIFAGYDKLPYPSSSSNQGVTTCGYNKPTVGVPIEYASYLLPDKPVDNELIFINLHRYTTSPSDLNPPTTDVSDQIVGSLITKQKMNGTTYLAWVDVMYNPCKSMQCPSLIC
jgi:hypothetical protein